MQATRNGGKGTSFFAGWRRVTGHAPVLGALIYLTVNRSAFETISDEMYHAAMLLLRTRDLADRFLVDAVLQPVSGKGHLGCVHVPLNVRPIVALCLTECRIPECQARFQYNGAWFLNRK